MEHGIVKDWNDMERIWQYVYSKDQLQTFSEEVRVLCSGQPSGVCGAGENPDPGDEEGEDNRREGWGVTACQASDRMLSGRAPTHLHAMPVGQRYHHLQFTDTRTGAKKPSRESSTAGVQSHICQTAEPILFNLEGLAVHSETPGNMHALGVSEFPGEGYVLFFESTFSIEI